ncbi:MAG: GxxExxY protein [Proteobacteria bacterium]|nr:GxxExxY protein [Pseudomonadota bacterium]
MVNLDVTNDLLSKQVVDSIFHVHKSLGPGLLESVYEECLVHTLKARQIAVTRQKTIPIQFDGMTLDAGLKLDLLIEDSIIVELKSVEKILPVHEAQILSYLKLAGIKTGVLVNFNVPMIKDGIRRFVKSS